MMDLVNRAGPSLWWRLSWQLSLVIVAVLATVITGLCVYGAMILSPNTALEDKVVSVIADAIIGDPAKKIEIKETAELLRLREQNRDLWYVVATKSGVSTFYGIVPEPYAELAGLVHLFDDADIRGAVGTNDIATIKSVATTVGEIRILFGGVADKGWPVLALLTRSYPIYFSLLAIALPTIFLAVPHIVRHGLARVSDVAQMASRIDFRRQEARLPVDGIPREIAPLVVGFNGALERLESGFQRRRRFLIDAAHELRTPIAIMQTRIEGITDDRERRSLLDDVARLAETAEQLLDFERNSQAIDQFETVDLVTIVKGVVADLAPQAIAAGYQISFQSDVVCLECKCSTFALPRAVSNLVRNAIDHGGGEGMITVAVSAGGLIEVMDEGPGIPIDDQELVFEPFYRVTPKSIGAGLGLSLVKQIVANHHGQVSLKSNPGGTRVTIQL
jgi:signal transduction histidine kinase